MIMGPIYQRARTCTESEKVEDDEVAGNAA